MKKRIVAWLLRYGFAGPLCSIYRIVILENHQLALERFYRWRWQRLHVDGPKSWSWDWHLGSVEARFLDAGQAFNGLAQANVRAIADRKDRRVVKRITVDADASPKDVAAAIAPDQPEDAETPGPDAKTAVPPVLERATKSRS